MPIFECIFIEIDERGKKVEYHKTGMAIFINKVSLKKSDGQTNIYKYRVGAHKILQNNKNLISLRH